MIGIFYFIYLFWEVFSLNPNLGCIYIHLNSNELNKNSSIRVQIKLYIQLGK